MADARRRLHVATSPLTGAIYCGSVLKDGQTWAANKTDVTGQACAAVAHHALHRSDGAKRVELTVTANGKPAYRITVEALEGADHA